MLSGPSLDTHFTFAIKFLKTTRDSNRCKDSQQWSLTTSNSVPHSRNLFLSNCFIIIIFFTFYHDAFKMNNYKYFYSHWIFCLIDLSLITWLNKYLWMNNNFILFTRIFINKNVKTRLLRTLYPTTHRGQLKWRLASQDKAL